MMMVALIFINYVYRIKFLYDGQLRVSRASEEFSLGTDFEKDLDMSELTRPVSLMYKDRSLTTPGLGCHGRISPAPPGGQTL